MRKTPIIVGTLLVTLLLVLGACAPAPPSPKVTQQPTSEWMDYVADVWVGGYFEDWDEDADYDGIEIYVGFVDENDQAVMVRGIELPVRIEFIDRDTEEIIYETTASFNDESLKYGTIVSSEGRRVARVPFEALPPTAISGDIVATVTLPNQKTYSSKWAMPFTP